MNTYSPTWFAVFGNTVDPAQTGREVDWLMRQLPLPAFQNVFDIACGAGRHSLPLAAAGHEVIGIDSDLLAIAQAQLAASARAGFAVVDMRDLSALPRPADGLICMWQSFGAFDAATNAHVLGQMTALLRPGGRLVLDVYHRLFFAQHAGGRDRARAGMAVKETSHMDGDRLSVGLEYADGTRDDFSWQLWTPAELSELAAPLGLAPLLSCTGFAEDQPASADQPRFQIVFELAAGEQS